MIDPNAIVALKVYPPIGVARVGNAAGADDYVIGPETIGGAPTLPGDERGARTLADFRNAEGAIKRQAARFRVYAHMKDNSVHEITSDDAVIEWSVSVANLKAGWYDFNQAMDLGPISGNAGLRNLALNLPLRARSRLDITPTPRTIAGPGAGPIAFDDGAFCGNSVYLGELRTDARGRLIFLGGHGAANPFRSGLSPLTFANNVGWHDDICDGPVRARVVFPGFPPIDAEPGYVTSTPPNYAPGLFGVVTMDDAVREVFYEEGWIARPASTDFDADVAPIFRRLSGLQWVNHGLFVIHGFGSPLDAGDPGVLARLNDPSAANAAWRKAVFDLFRDPNLPGGKDTFAPSRIPQAYGDGVDTIFGSGSHDASGELAVTKTQYAHLQRWAAGAFTPSAAPEAPPEAPVFSTLSPAEQVRHLERASLHDCLGGPFHPAMEMTWVMRIPRLWASPYRLKVLPGDDPAKQYFGPVLTPAACLAEHGPYDGAAAGCLTRFLGVPWHTDHTSCNSSQDLDPSAYLSMPTFWGARAPDQVLSEGDYRRAAALADEGPEAVRQILKHLMNRVDWLRDIRGNDYFDRLTLMIREWAELGMVLPVEGEPAALGVAGLRVEQGRLMKGKPYELDADPKYVLTKAVEALFAPAPAAAPVAAAAAQRRVAQPLKRVYRQGAI